MKSLSLTLMAACLVMPATAKVWTVAQHPGANFATISGAIAAATAGDTILVAGAGGAYEGGSPITLTKRVVIIGPGYFLDENTGLQALPSSAIVNGMTFSSGSSGTVVMGLHFTAPVQINTNSITLRRNRLVIASGFVSGVVLASNVNDITITQCYMYMYASGAYLIQLSTLDSNVVIKNNYLESVSNFYSVIYGTNAFTGSVSNNVIWSSVSSNGIDLNSASFNNNIIRNGGIALNGVTPYHNICNSTQLSSWTGAPYNNQVSQNMTSVFVDPTGLSSDAKWQIETSGPADDTALGGGDCGMFDTSENNAYVLSGVPEIPAVYEFTANSDLSNVTVKVKSNN